MAATGDCNDQVDLPVGKIVAVPGMVFIGG